MLAWTRLIGTLAGAVLLAGAATGCRATTGAPQPQMTSGAEKPEIVEELWPNGQPRVRRQVLTLADGTQVNHGVYLTWYDNGQKEYEGVFVRGQNDGVATSWHRNGQKRIEEQYALGKRHGDRYTWDENGTLRKEEHFVDDQPDGVWTTWDAKGQIKAQQRFDHGVPQ